MNEAKWNLRQWMSPHGATIDIFESMFKAQLSFAWMPPTNLDPFFAGTRSPGKDILS